MLGSILAQALKVFRKRKLILNTKRKINTAFSCDEAKGFFLLLDNSLINLLLELDVTIKEKDEFGKLISGERLHVFFIVQLSIHIISVIFNKAYDNGKIEIIKVIINK